MKTSASSARRATRIVAAGSTARKSARTFPIRRLPRPKRCPGISRRRGVTGSANSLRAQYRLSGSRFAPLADEMEADETEADGAEAGAADIRGATVPIEATDKILSLRARASALATCRRAETGHR